MDNAATYFTYFDKTNSYMEETNIYDKALVFTTFKFIKIFTHVLMVIHNFMLHSGIEKKRNINL